MLDSPTITPPPTSAPTEGFAHRHNGPTPQEVADMLAVLGYSSLDALIDRIVPESIRLDRELELPAALSEADALAKLRAIAAQNQVFRSYIGQGYHDCITPPVIQRNVLENPGWYTAYTPYQPEIAQGRLEALLNFQTMVMDLTGLEIANASLLDEGTAAAEAMSMSLDVSKAKQANTFFIDRGCHPQTIAVVQTRAIPLGVETIVGNWKAFDFSSTDTPVFGVLLQYPATNGQIEDYRQFVATAHKHRAIVTVAADILSLALLTPPGEFGADVAVGTTQRLGVPMGFGGPHAAYFATKTAYQRKIPGRVVGVSKDVNGNWALRLALQTREQHIRRDKATSNICTAQVLLAVMASMYAVYHGPVGIQQIAQGIHDRTVMLAIGLEQLGYTIQTTTFFDTIAVSVDNAATMLERARAEQVNLRQLDAVTVCLSLDETTSDADVCALLEIFSDDALFTDADAAQSAATDLRDRAAHSSYPLIGHDAFHRTSSYLTEPVFNRYHSETEMLRYLHRLQGRDLSLAQSMIPLGSCTMKLNSTAEMIPVTWPEFGKLHPFTPAQQAEGYRLLCHQLETWLAEITGFAAISLQPNAGSQGEYAGLQAIRAYHQSRGDVDRTICLIPESAHGTNPASAVMCGMKVVAVKCDDDGNIDLADLTAKADQHPDRLAALMVTYPSTHGVFETTIVQICQLVHDRGGQVYMDGANMNAQVGLCRPGDFGADVCHLNLHKTFCIPHGGGGPGVGPIGVMSHLAPFLPSHPVRSPLSPDAETTAIGPISAAPWGSASILPISWMYIAMMGADGLTDATKLAILNANYMAARLDEHYPVLYKGNGGLVAHECILDLRSLRKSADITVEDIAKRLMDYGYHAPTVSWPVAGTVMVEPTESESKVELDRFCDAMVGIRQEIARIESGEFDREDNPLKHAPHTAQSLLCGDWERGYPRQVGAYPAAWTKENKFWPGVGRIDNVFGDRNLICSCVGMDAYRN